MSSTSNLPSPEVLRRLTDAHCHPTDSETPDHMMDALNIKVCAMATRSDDQQKVKALADAWPDKVTPCFGYHPWFSHTISLLETPPSKLDHYSSLFFPADGATLEQSTALAEMLEYLPDPRALSSILSELRANLEAQPRALLGEVGIDRAFRVPLRPYPSPPGRKLSPFFVPLEHQLRVLEEQLAVAVELRRNVSLHSVKSQAVTVQLLERMRGKHGEAWGKINVDLHSCGLSPETWKELERDHPNVYMSLSTTINAKSSSLRSLIATASPERLLVESDWHRIDYNTQSVWDMVLMLADVKGWKVEDRWEAEPDGELGAVRRLEKNWSDFIARGRGIKTGKKGQEGFSRKQRKMRDYTLNEEETYTTPQTRP